MSVTASAAAARAQEPRTPAPPQANHAEANRASTEPVITISLTASIGSTDASSKTAAATGG
jgi:hypothetical protein